MEKKCYVPAGEMFPPMQELLDKGYDAEFTVTGNSMWPLLSHSRDRVVLRKKMPKNGDIVLFCPVEGKYLLHRIHWLKNGRFTTSGDGNCFYDGSFPMSCLVGTVIMRHRKNKCYAAQGFPMRLWSFLWRLCFPVRPLLLKLLRAIAARRR